MDNHLLVSIIITNYNYSCYLGECIESVLNQTYLNWELIIVDDGSTDNSMEIINKYIEKDKRIRKYTQRNAGQNEAFNLGFSHAKGDIVCILDSDDKYYPTMLENKVESHMKYPDRVCCDTAITMDGLNLQTNVREDLDYHELLLQNGYLYAHNMSSGLSFRRKALVNFMPLIHTNMMWGGLDCVLMHIALVQTKPIIDKRIGAMYRVHQNYQRKEKKQNESGKYGQYIKELRKYARMQLQDKGILIPDDEYGYYQKVVEELKPRLLGKQMVGYGTSEISKKIYQAFASKGLDFLFYSDNAKCRKPFEVGVELNREIVPSKLLPLCQKKIDVIIIASRQSNEIRKYLEGMDLDDVKIISLPI